MAHRAAALVPGVPATWRQLTSTASPAAGPAIVSLVSLEDSRRAGRSGVATSQPEAASARARHRGLARKIDETAVFDVSPVGWRAATACVPAVGIGPILLTECIERRGKPGDRLRLCSNGLTKAVSEAEIALVIGLRVPTETVNHLTHRALDRGAPNNVSSAATVVAGFEPTNR